MRSIPRRLLGAGALSALLLDLPFPIAGPLPAWRAVFAWIALVPLLAGLLRVPTDYAGRGWRWQLGWSFMACWLCGALWFGVNDYWVYGTMHLYGDMNEAMAAVCLVAFSLYLGFWFGVFGLALALVRRATAGTRWVWLGFAAVPLMWTAMEFAIARIPEFPWDQLGYSQIDNGLLMRLPPITGVYGVSFLLAGVNALLAVGLVLAPSRGQFSVRGYFSLLGAFVAVVGAAGLFLSSPHLRGDAMAVLVQPNLDVSSDGVWQEAEWKRHLAQFQAQGAVVCRNYFRGLPESGEVLISDANCNATAFPELIVWPESPAPFRDVDARFRQSMAEIAQADHAAMIVGDIGIDEDRAGRTHFYNSASVIAVDGRFTGRYDKIHLVPFGEYVPFRKVLFFVHQLTEQLSDMGSGADRKVFSIAGQGGVAHRYGIFICYEAVFADEIRQFARNGAEVFVNISDDGWYGDTSAPWQHLNMARMRAIENRRWIVRDTNNGVTSAIDSYGTVRQSIPRHQVDALAARYGFNSELTFYTVHGDWLAALCAILSLVLLVWSARVSLGYATAAKRP